MENAEVSSMPSVAGRVTGDKECHDYRQVDFGLGELRATEVLGASVRLEWVLLSQSLLILKCSSHFSAMPLCCPLPSTLTLWLRAAGIRRGVPDTPNSPNPGARQKREFPSHVETIIKKCSCARLGGWSSYVSQWNGVNDQARHWGGCCWRN